MITASGVMGIAAYLGTAANIIINKSQILRGTLAIYILAILSHGWLLYRSIDTPIGHNLNVANLLSMSFWVAAIVLLIGLSRVSIQSLTAIFCTLCALTISFVITSTNNNVIVQLPVGHTLHVLLAVASISISALTGLQAAIIALQTFLIKNKPMHRILNLLPSLEDNERLWHFFLKSTYITISVMLISTKLTIAPKLSMWSDNKAIFALGSWLAFTWLVFMNKGYWYTSSTSKIWSIIAALTLVFSYLGSKIFLSPLH